MPAGRAGCGAPALRRLPFYIDRTIPRITVTIARRQYVGRGRHRKPRRPRALVAVSRGASGIAALARTPAGVVGFGVGGPALARLGRVPAVQIGPYTLSNVVTSFTYPSQGAFAGPVQSREHRRRDLAAIHRDVRLRAQQMLLAKNCAVRRAVFLRSLGIISDRRRRCVYRNFGLSRARRRPRRDWRRATSSLAVNERRPRVNRSLHCARCYQSRRERPFDSTFAGSRGDERDVTLKLADYV